MSGKSQAIYEYIVALCEHDSTKRIGITNEYSYNILKGRGVNEECLIKCWEPDYYQRYMPEVWWDDIYDY